MPEMCKGPASPRHALPIGVVILAQFDARGNRPRPGGREKWLPLDLQPTELDRIDLQ